MPCKTLKVDTKVVERTPSQKTFEFIGQVIHMLAPLEVMCPVKLDNSFVMQALSGSIHGDI